MHTKPYVHPDVVYETDIEDWCNACDRPTEHTLMVITGNLHDISCNECGERNAWAANELHEEMSY